MPQSLLPRRRSEPEIPGLDRIDRRILAALQADGRITNLELADKVGLSPTATAERVKRLTREGYILGYMARLDPAKLHRGLLVFVEIKLDRMNPEVFSTFAAAVTRAPEVLECHLIAGGFDYLVKARVHDMDAYRIFLSDVLMALPGVRETHTYPVMEEVKDTATLPL
ncbi:MAG TPA: Lrp/AsnC ligand binding domain-containing protein [Methylomirabilota bacterium]|nr:Lrp/AsnC ligand binding domain-containing protein [Methylomirabilota bacterium]